MTTTRGQRIVRRVLLTSAAVALLLSVWLIVRKPPEIERSRAIKVGMTWSQAEELMGRPASFSHMYIGSGRSVVLVGESATRWWNLRCFLWKKYPVWFPLRGSDGVPQNWPVRIHVDENGLVNAIERESEIEGVALPRTE